MHDDAPEQALRPVDLRTERRVEPLGLDDAAPLLSWRLEGAGRRRTQTAYRVRVAVDADPREESVQAVWDSGELTSEESVDVPYEGVPLRSATRYVWCVRVVDEAGADSGWSEPASFETGLLAEEDWAAEWIGSPADLDLRRAPHLDGPAVVERIWTPGGAAEHAVLGATLHVPGTRPVLGARLAVGGSPEVRAWLNGRPVPVDGTDTDAVLAAVRTGPNTLVVTDRAADPARPAGVVARLDVLREDAAALTLVTDGAWRVLPAGDPRELSAAAVPEDLPQAAPLARHGDAPTGREPVTYRPSPYLRRAFTLNRPVRRARLYATALGVHELRLSGRRVGADRLAPGWTDYARRVPYRTHDVTDLVRQGENVLGAVLADGWYAGNICWFGRFHYGDRRLLRARLVVEHDDGSETVVTTGPEWTCGEGAIRFSDLQNGEVVDARCAADGWDSPGFDGEWGPVLVDRPAVGPLEEQTAPPVEVLHEIAPVALHRHEGRTVLDFGQNLVGWVRLRLRAEAGTHVILRHAEVLDGDQLYTENLRAARCVDEYLARGDAEGEVFEPKFTVHGFRYCEVIGVPDVREEDVVARVAYAAMDPVGEFTCSDPHLNQLQSNIVWGQRGNFLSVPTDCPQRDERLGWTGDIQVFASTAAFNYDVRGFLRKYLRDLADATVDGRVPHVAPDVLTPASGTPWGGAAGWGDAAVVLPFALLEAYGDRRAVEETMPLVEAWLGYLERHSEDGVRPDDGFGDWLALTPTPSDLVSTAFYAHAARLGARLAEGAGHKDRAERWHAVHERVRAAFRRRWVTGGGRVASGTQTAYVLALHFDLLEPAERPAAAEHLVEAIQARNQHLSTGFLGTPYLLPVLSRFGHEDVAHRLLLQDTFPSWLYPVVHGDATTVWERWDSWSDSRGLQDPSMNSFNHYAYGAVGEWMYRELGGLAPLEPGYRRVRVRPRPGGGVEWARTSLDTPYGPVRVEWRLEGGRLVLETELPPGVCAEVVLPASAVADVREGGVDVASAEGVTVLGPDGEGGVRLETGSGRYRFETV